MLSPKATAQSKPLYTGTLTSAEVSGQEDSTTPTVSDARNWDIITWMTPVIKNQVQQHGVYVEASYTHTESIAST